MRARFDRILSTESPAIHEAGQRLYHRIANEHWSVEWNLPRWLGSVCGLTKTQQSSLLAVNVYGLGYVRLFDDRQDGETLLAGIPQAENLEARLFDAAQCELHKLMGEHPDFWDSYHAIMQRWRDAVDSLDVLGSVLKMSPERLARIADVGAPLMISALACAVLQTRAFRFAELQAPVRHYLIAAVLYDHLKDWQSDLRANRANLFIEAMLGPEPTAGDQRHIQSRIYQAFLERSRLRADVELIYEHLERGAEAAQKIDLIPFARHLLALEAEARASAEEKLEGIQRYLSMGMELFLPA